MTVSEAFNQIKVMASRKDFDGLYDVLESLNDSAYDCGFDAGVDFAHWDTEDE